MASPSATRAPRRRQRSIRLTVAVALLMIAALVVIGAALSGAWLPVTVAAGLAVVLGAVATRITHSELAESRREAARDRAVQAQGYRELTVERTAEHGVYVASMQARIAEYEVAIEVLEATVTTAHERVGVATLKLNSEARRADVAETDARALTAQLDESEQRAAQAIVLLAELEAEIDVTRAELEVVTTAWHAAEAPHLHTRHA